MHMGTTSSREESREVVEMSKENKYWTAGTALLSEGERVFGALVF